jgi:hypothetical protein
MVFVDWLNVRSRGGMAKALRGRKWREVLTAAFLGATPGCLGSFMNVSLYVHGLIGFGALVGGMIATSGDEAYVMLSLFPGKALFLFAALFVSGIVFGVIADRFATWLKIVPCEGCDLHEIHPEEFRGKPWNTIRTALRRPSSTRVGFLVFMAALFLALALGGVRPEETWMKITLGILLLFGVFLGLSSSEHYLREHIVRHILLRHTLRVFAWTLAVLLILSFLPSQDSVRAFLQNHMVWVFLFAALLGIIPESGPHLIFVLMFANGLVPFSVLFVSSFVQDGHGMLPLLSVSVRDSLKVKAFNLVFGLAVGSVLYLSGI